MQETAYEMRISDWSSDVCSSDLHIVQRGNNRQACFPGRSDYLRYLQCLRDAAGERECSIHAYVLMTNHVHLLATPQTRGAVGLMMQDIGRRFEIGREAWRERGCQYG